jgi:hypothetical protein
MRRSILVVAVVITAILVASSAAAYAKQSGTTSPDTTSPDTSTSDTNTSDTTGPITSQNHSWGGYHWARTSNPFTVKVGDNVSSNWDTYLGSTSTDWSESTVLDAPIVPGKAINKRCSATAGQIEVCNGKYGNNGWLGIASIWLQSGTNHIAQGTTKINDTYFNQAKYNNPNEKQHVMCQEVGHDFGLDHQSEDGTSLNTCMDYFSNTGTNSESTQSTHPNQHDYDELITIYSHVDSTTTIGASAASKGRSGDNETGDGPPAWGKEVFRSSDGKASLYEKDLSNGQKKVTHVTWTDEQAEKRGQQA